jgi:transcriptional regulator with XRE-family HTH domain
VRELREGQELSLRELARRSNMTPTGISMVEQGQRSPSSETIEKLARGLGVAPGVLFGAPLSKPPPPRTIAELLDAAGVEDRELENSPGHVSKRFEGLETYEETKALAGRIISARRAVVAFIAEYEKDQGTTPEDVEALKRLATHTFLVNAVAIAAAGTVAEVEKARAEAEGDLARAAKVAEELEEFSKFALQAGA